MSQHSLRRAFARVSLVLLTTVGGVAAVVPNAGAQDGTAVRNLLNSLALSTCVNNTAGVVACLAPSSEITRVTAYSVDSTVGTTLPVYGYVDLYRFVLPTTTVTLPCTVSGGLNPCATAGGTYVSRFATLINTSVVVPSGQLVPIAAVAVCNATLTLTVDGIGINAAPAISVC
jgi:hypothetical protein